LSVRIGFALAAGLALIAVPAQAQKARNWETTLAVTAEGTHVAGNPDAEMKLIEFVSYSCVHCANFMQQADGAMRLAYIQPGKMQVEVRHVIRNQVDLAAALLTECGPSGKFFANHRLMMMKHDEWMAKAVIANQAQQQRWSSGPFAARMQASAAITASRWTAAWRTRRRRGSSPRARRKMAPNSASTARQPFRSMERYCREFTTGPRCKRR
jgi:protein-disulfide isomerase